MYCLPRHIISSFLIFCMMAGISAGTLHADSFHPETGEELSDNQTFSYRMLDEFPTLDPQLNQDSEGFDVLRDLFEGLYNQDATGNLVPGVAERHVITNANRTYIFHLRDTAKWSNGDPLTAHDFVYAWRRAVDPAMASPYAWYVGLSMISNASEIIAGETLPEDLGVTAVDDYTLEVHLEQPLPYFPEMTTYATFFPTHRSTIERYGAAWTRPENIVSNGAYILTKHVPKEYHTRERNPYYWNNNATFIEQVTGKVVNDENLALTRYLAGELDMTGVPSGQYPNLLASYPDEAKSVPILCSYYFAINHTDSGHPALRDQRVRKALSYAIDRDVIVNSVLKGGQYPAYNFTHWATAGFKMPGIDYIKLSQVDRDSIAKSLMQEAGYGRESDLKFRFIYNTSESHKLIATVVSQMWKQKLGIEVELANYEWKTYLDIRSSQQFDLARAGWCGDYNEASTFLDVMTSGNTVNSGRFSNSQVDHLMEEAKKQVDPQSHYSEVEIILADEMAIIPVYHYSSVFMLKTDIKGWPYDNVQKQWYSKDLYRTKEYSSMN